jgi:hypothetical protein
LRYLIKFGKFPPAEAVIDCLSAKQNEETNEKENKEMSDATSIASTALQTQVSAGLAGPAGSAAILALANALVSSAQAYAISVQSRRIGILAGELVPAYLPLGVRIVDLAGAWNEVASANQFLGQANALNSAVAPLRATDSTGTPAAAFIAGIPVANLNTWAANLIAGAATFEALELTTLPA